MIKKNCFSCGKKDLEKDIIALNKKLLGRNIEKYFCLSCMSDYLGLAENELKDKIEEFKEQGCTLFR